MTAHPAAPRRRRPLALLAALLLAAAPALAACGNEDRPAAAPAPPGAGQDAAAVRGFLQAMVPHHRSATGMAALAPRRAELPAVRRIARTIARTQAEEIGQMRAIHHRLFGAPLREDMMGHAALGLSARAAGMDHMDGARTIARAEPFDRAFLREMIPHHEGAMRMAEAVVPRTRDPQLRALAREIVTAQRREIEEMQALLEREYDDPA